MSANNTLNPITGSFGTTTYTWASNTANFSNLTGGRLASFALGTSLPAGHYFVGFQMSTNNNSSIGTATTQLANTISVLLGANYTASAFNDFASTANNQSDIMYGMGVYGATITATNQTINMGNISQVGASKLQGNIHVLFRNIL